MSQGSSNPTTNLTKIKGVDVSVNTGVKDAGTQRVVLATDQTVIPISDNGGSLTVDGTFWQATQPVSLVSVPSHAVTNAGTFAVQAAQSGTWTVQPGNTANTTPWLMKSYETLGIATLLGALNANITQALNGNMGAAAVITAAVTPSGVVLTPYASYDGGVNYVATTFFNVTNGLASTTISTFAVGDSYSIEAGDGATHVKVQATSWTSGSVTVKLSVTNSQGLVNLKSSAVHDDIAGTYTQLISGYASSTTPTAVVNGDASRLWTTLNGALNIADGGGSITVDGTFWQATQPVSGTVSVNALPVGTNTIGSVKLTDGTNTGVIKAASTAALATDPALVVAISPNNVLSITSATLATAANQATMITHIDGIETLLTTIEGDTSAIQTSVQLLDDTIISDNTAIGATKLLAIGGTDGTNAQMLSVNASGHVNIADGGNSITVDAPVGTPAFVRLSNGTSAVDTLPVSGTFWQATQPVSNAGTFAVQAAQSGTWNIGSITTLPALPAGTNAIGKLVANANVVIGGTEAVPSVNNALTNVNTTAYASSLIAKASAGKIYNIVGYNSKATGQFIQIHNSATLPADTAVPVIIFYVGPMSNFSLDYGVYGKSFSAGITICNSTTGPTKTLGAADCWFTAEVI